MAGVDLLTNVIINGQTTAGFNALSRRLTEMGTTIEQIGGRVREFEQESVQVYRKYEDNMLAAEYALSAQYDSASELARVMQDLDTYASAWAAGTIFHTDDVSRAINEAAHAGWDYTQIVKGIPQAMLIAQAGGLELSTGLDYLVKMMGATSTEFDDMGTLIDEWSRAANLSATNIGEMGEAFRSLGASATYADSTQEIFTLLAVLADVGTVGAQAGTALRGAMMRIIAPTSKAEDAMSLLGADAEELEDVLSEESVTKAAKKLEGLGFSAYDASGDLLPMIDIFTNLNTALKGLDEQARNEILAAIFPTRTNAQANAFLQAVESGKLQEYYQNIGDSEGYAARGADIMMSGLTGSIETLLSKLEEFKRSVGETLAPTIETLAGSLGGILDVMNSWDQVTMSALVGGMSALSVIGPGLFITGAAIKFFATLGPVGTTMLLLAVGTSALVSGLKELNDINFKENFGEMALDLDALGQHVTNLETRFSKQQETIATWETALDGATEKFSNASMNLAEKLLEGTITGDTLGEAEQKQLAHFAEVVVTEAQKAIQSAEGLDLNFLEAVLGGPGASEADRGALDVASAIVGHWYDDVYAEANAIGQELRAQLTAALTDNTIDAQEREAIQATQDRLNQIMAEINAGMESADYYTALERAQRVSWDSLSSFFEQTSGQLDEMNRQTNEAYDRAKGTMRAAYADARAKGYKQVVINGKRYHSIDEAHEKQALDALERQRQAALQDNADKTGEMVFTALDAALGGAGFGEAWDLMKRATVDELGNVDLSHMFEGMNAEELDAANEALSHLYENVMRIQGDLPGEFWDSAMGDRINSMLWASGQAAEEATRWEYSLRAAGEGATVFGTGAMVPEIDTAPVEEARLEMETTLGEPVNSSVAFPDAGSIAQATRRQIELEFSSPIFQEVQIRRSNLFTLQLPLKAEGGRAATPSIFGEDGPEWAIPEEHSERTAALLNAAREASGFGWGDLISRFGGLGGSAGGQQVTINYAPTINTQDAQGVNDALASDKARLLRMIKQALAEDRLRDEVEVFA